MVPRWLTIEKLVAELGGVCTAGPEVKALPGDEHGLDDSPTEATRAVAAALAVPELDDPTPADEVVCSASRAIAVAQERLARLSEEIARSRTLRDNAQEIQDHSFGLRLRDRRQRR
jgi:hypothetical protein